MRVRVIRKLAERVDGVDLSHCGVGDVIDLVERDARMILAEEWAEPARRTSDSSARGMAADRRGARRYYRLRHGRGATEPERRRLGRRATDEMHAPAPDAS